MAPKRHIFFFLSRFFLLIIPPFNAFLPFALILPGLVSIECPKQNDFRPPGAAWPWIFGFFRPSSPAGEFFFSCSVRLWVTQ